MYAQMFQNSWLIVFPLIALVLFIPVFLTMIVMVVRSGKRGYDPVAALPLGEDEPAMIEVNKEAPNVR
jgi:hypothetical protein